MLAGSAYAGAKIGSKDIARDAVKAKHINAGAVRAEELAGFEVASATGKLALDVDTTSITDTETADLAASPNGKLRLEARCFWEGQLDMVLVAGVRLVATDTGSLLSGTQGNMPFSKRTAVPDDNLRLAELEGEVGSFQQQSGQFSAIGVGDEVLAGVYHLAINNNGAGEDCTFSAAGFG